jgi:hypothetical protein
MLDERFDVDALALGLLAEAAPAKVVQLDRHGMSGQSGTCSGGPEL